MRARPLADYAGFHLVCLCDPCKRTQAVPIERIIARIPDADKATARVGEAATRLRCQVCGRPPSQIVVTNGEQMRVTISGAGSV